MNQVTTRATTALATADDYYAALAAEAQTYKGGGDGHLFLKMDGNTGYYSYGADDIELPDGTQAAFDPRTLKRGWICWNDSKMIEEIMLSLEEGSPPPKHLLPEHGPYKAKNDGWSEQKSIIFKTIEGDNLQLLFQANNKSKMNALEALMKSFARDYKSNPGCYPVVELSSNSFETQERNEAGEKVGRKLTKYAPKFDIVGWMSEEELLELSQGAAEDYPAEEEQAQLEAPVEEAAVEEVAPPPAATGGRRTAPASAVTGRPANTVAQARPQATAPAAAPAAAPARTGRRF